MTAEEKRQAEEFEYYVRDMALAYAFASSCGAS
jgi:hypothetical protein